MASRRRQEGEKKVNAEGMHGDRTHQAIMEQLKHKLPEPADPAHPADVDRGQEKPAPLKAHAQLPDGKHRLSEGRKQHDEANRDSEKNRLARETNSTSGGHK